MEIKKFDDLVFTDIYEIPESLKAKNISFDEDKKIIDCEINDETKKFFCKEIENLDRSALCDCYTIWIKKTIDKLIDCECKDYDEAIGILMQNADDIYFKQNENSFYKFDIEFIYKEKSVSRLCIDYEKEKIEITIDV